MKCLKMILMKGGHQIKHQMIIDIKKRKKEKKKKKNTNWRIKSKKKMKIFCIMLSKVKQIV